MKPPQQQAARVTTLASQRQRHVCASTMAMTPLWREQQLPSQQQRRQLGIDGETPACRQVTKAIISMMTTCHCNKGHNASFRMATTSSWLGQQPCRGSRLMMPLLWGRWCHHDDGKDACTSTEATMSSSWGGQLHWRQQQRCLHINSNNAIMTRATTPAWGWAPRVTMLVQWQRHACASTTATTPSWQEQQSPLQQWQRCLHINGNDAIMTRATTPAWQKATRAATHA